MNVTSRDSRSRPSSVSLLTTFFEAQAEQFKDQQHIYLPNKIDHVRYSCKTNDDINKLKNGHLVSDRRRLFENSNLQDKKKNDNIPGDRHDNGIQLTSSNEVPDKSTTPNHPPEVIRRPPKPQPAHSVEEIRRSVMDTIIKYLEEGVSSDDDEDNISTEMTENEVEECEDMIRQLPNSWSRLNLNIPDEEEIPDEKLNSPSKEIAKCVEEVNGEFNDLISLTEEKDKGEVNVRRSGNFLKNTRSSTKRKKTKKVTEDVVYSYSRFSSDDSTKTEDDTDKEKCGASPFFDSFSFASTSTFESDDSEDIFGRMTEINDFIVETYNYREKNVLYRLTLQKEPILIPTFNENNYPALEDCATSSSSVANEEIHSDVEDDVKRDENLREDYEDPPPPYEKIYNFPPESVDVCNVENVDDDIEKVTVEEITCFDETERAPNHVYENWVFGQTLQGSYYDEDSNPRITITCESSPEMEKKFFLDVPKINESQLPSPTPKKQHIIDELRDTEKKYLDELEYVVLEYLKHFTNHPSVRHIGVDLKEMFGNIEDIFQATDNFYERLCQCGYSVERIAQLFLDSEELFQLSSDYMRNKSKTQHIYEQYNPYLYERQRQLNDKKTCDSYLLSPVQRPTRHKLLLESLSKDLKKHDEPSKLLDEAIMFIDRKISEANWLLAIDSILSCPIDLTSKGNLLLQDPFNIKRKYKGYIFLFEDIVVFTTESKTRHIFEYKDSIPSLALSLKHKTNSSSFTLINFSKSKDPKFDEGDYSFEVEAATPQVSAKWVKEINNILWNQLSTFKDLQAKKYSITHQSPVIEQKLRNTLPSIVRKKKPSIDSTRTSVFYVTDDYH